MTTAECPDCARPFECGAEDTLGCWCAAYPRVPVSLDTAGCRCPTCLAREVGAALEAYIDRHGTDRALELAQAHAKAKPLLEHIDYSVENELTVFSRWFHLKRGHCCGNACRHCPFDHIAVR